MPLPPPTFSQHPLAQINKFIISSPPSISHIDWMEIKMGKNQKGPVERNHIFIFFHQLPKKFHPHIAHHFISISSE
jgi:hypothetical protein